MGCHWRRRQQGRQCRARARGFVGSAGVDVVGGSGGFLDAEAASDADVAEAGAETDSTRQPSTVGGDSAAVGTCGSSRTTTRWYFVHTSAVVTVAVNGCLKIAVAAGGGQGNQIPSQCRSRRFDDGSGYGDCRSRERNVTVGGTGLRRPRPGKRRAASQKHQGSCPDALGCARAHASGGRGECHVRAAREQAVRA